MVSSVFSSLVTGVVSMSFDGDNECPAHTTACAAVS